MRHDFDNGDGRDRYVRRLLQCKNLTSFDEFKKWAKTYVSRVRLSQILRSYTKVIGNYNPRKRNRGRKQAVAEHADAADTFLLSVLHMSVIGQDLFISKIICFLGRHPDSPDELGPCDETLTWTIEEHRGSCGQNCPRCRSNEEDWLTVCFLCNQMWDPTTVNRQWRDRTREFDGKGIT